VAPFHTNYARSDGLRVAYSDVGSGPPIIFLHGIGATRDVWDPQLRSLCARFRCIAVEFRGYGESDAALARDASRAAYARDAFAAMTAAKVEAAHICGLSLGGIIALECYRTEPRRVRSLALADTFAYHPRGVELLGERLKGLVDVELRRIGRRQTNVIERLRRQLRAASLTTYLASVREAWTADYRNMLPSVRVPALVMVGEHDRAVAPLRFSRELADGLPDCRGLIVIPDADHESNADNPAMFNEALARFVDEVVRGA